MAIDLSTDLGNKVAKRLGDDQIIWLTTSSADGSPQPSPVWFLWNDGKFLIFSQPNQVKLKNIARNRRVALHLNSNATGGDVAVINGSAVIDPGQPTPAEETAYVGKYGEPIKRIGMTNESFRKSYSTVVRVTPEKLRGH